jgi:hypothetical protein
MDPEQDKPAHESSTPRKAGFGATMRAVFWSFFGVRKRQDYEHDAAHLNPVHLIVAALIGVALFIGVLVLLVRVAVARG